MSNRKTLMSEVNTRVLLSVWIIRSLVDQREDEVEQVVLAEYSNCNE